MPEKDKPPSPLSVADPESLRELAARDPLSLTDDDIDTLVAGYRAERTEYIKKQTTKTRTKKPRPSVEELLGGIEIP